MIKLCFLSLLVLFGMLKKLSRITMLSHFLQGIVFQSCSTICDLCYKVATAIFFALVIFPEKVESVYIKPHSFGSRSKFDESTYIFLQLFWRFMLHQLAVEDDLQMHFSENTFFAYLSSCSLSALGFHNSKKSRIGSSFR